MRSIIAVSVLAAVCLTICCGGSSTETNSNTVVVTNSNPANNASVEVMKPTTGIPANANVPTFSGNGNVQVVTPTGKAKALTFPAPDDSEYASSMDKSGSAIETRTFHSDPVIAKVVRVWKGVDDKSISIYLKSGKVVKVAGDKWPDIKSQPVQNFYEAAGVQPPTATKQSRTDQKIKPAEKP